MGLSQNNVLGLSRKFRAGITSGRLVDSLQVLLSSFSLSVLGHRAPADSQAALWSVIQPGTSPRSLLIGVFTQGLWKPEFLLENGV